MTDTDILDDLLAEWQDSATTGQPLEAQYLCRSNPELVPELKRRIEILLSFDRLVLLESNALEPATGFSSSTASLLPGRIVGKSAVPTPTILGGFELRRVLGEGGMGIVYEAWDTRLNRLVAVKVIKPQIAANPIARQRFLREARSAAQLQHHHIVPIYHVDEDQGTPFIVMPLLQGETLQERIRRDGSLPNDLLRTLARQIAGGLSSAHEVGLIHRDIKPANIWLRPLPNSTDVEALLLDFGLARSIEANDQLSQPGSVSGTPEYMSPEQIDGEELDARSDLFSFGSVLYYMATGKSPFTGSSTTAVMKAVALGEPMDVRKRNPSVAPQIESLILSLHAKNPKDRPISASAVIEQLEVTQTLPVAPKAGETTVLLPVPTPSSLNRAWQYRYWLAGIAAIFIVCLLIFWPDGKKPTITANSPAGQNDGADQPAKPVPLSLSLDIQVWKQLHGPGLSVTDLKALPLQEGDGMVIEIRANRAMYFYVLYLDATGEVSPVYPWEKYDWGNRTAQEPKSPTLILPNDPKDLKRLTAGPSGIESIIVLARDEPLKMEEMTHLRSIFATLPPQGKFDRLRGAVWLGEPGGDRFLKPEDRDRGKFGQDVAVEDPVQRIRRLVSGELTKFGAGVRGVCYPFDGEKK